MQQIERGIYYEDAYLGVTLGALVFPHGTILIDAPLRGEDTRSWRSSLINQRGGPNRLLVSLDAHPDRTLGTRALDCTIVAHQKTAQVFRNRPTIFKGQSLESGADWEAYPDVVGMRWASPDITFTESMSLHWGGVEVVLEHRLGPTPGSIWVVIPEAHVIFVGDAVVVDQPPFLAYADLGAWQENLAFLLRQCLNHIVVSGRGGLVSCSEIRLQQRYLKDINDGLERLARKNVTPEETEKLVSSLLAKYKVTPELHEKYANRLQYGLYHCYARRYRMVNVLGQVETGNEEQ
jgi:glyoxylase-like metal-dependent hydrolase (beta-lactamase superfamily II)